MHDQLSFITDLLWGQRSNVLCYKQDQVTMLKFNSWTETLILQTFTGGKQVYILICNDIKHPHPAIHPSTHPHPHPPCVCVCVQDIKVLNTPWRYWY